MPTIQPTNRPYAEPSDAAEKAPSNVAWVVRNRVTNAASAEANTTAAQPRTNAPAPPLIDFAVSARIAPTRTTSRMARKSWASSDRAAEFEPSLGPNAQEGQHRIRRNQ